MNRHYGKNPAIDQRFQNVHNARMKRAALALALLVIASGFPSAQPGPSASAEAPADKPARNVVVITIDGFRWQEMFGGPSPEYFKKDSKGQPTALEKQYTAGSAADRRVRLLPFVWK